MNTQEVTFDQAVAARYLDKMSKMTAVNLDQSNLVFLWNSYLVASYLYYVLDINVMSDSDYDKLCKHLLEHFDELESGKIWHKDLLSRDLLMAGSGFSISKWPPMIASIGIHISKMIKDTELVYVKYERPSRSVESSSTIEQSGASELEEAYG